jgi:AcrR family transcriptional regulator
MAASAWRRDDPGEQYQGSALEPSRDGVRRTSRTSHKPPIFRLRSVSDAAPKAQEGTGARERLLEAAAALIIERESIEISLADIAAKANLNSALVKYYFGSKTGLLVALLQRDAARALSSMEELLSLNISAGEKLRLHLRGIMNTYKRSPYLNRLLHALLHGPDNAVQQEVHRLLVQPVFNCQRHILAEGVASGEFKPVDHRIFYLSAIGACDQFMQTEGVVKLSQDGLKLDVFREQYINHVVNMVVASLSPK